MSSELIRGVANFTNESSSTYQEQSESNFLHIYQHSIQLSGWVIGKNTNKSQFRMHELRQLYVIVLIHFVEIVQISCSTHKDEINNLWQAAICDREKLSIEKETAKDLVRPIFSRGGGKTFPDENQIREESKFL